MQGADSEQKHKLGRVVFGIWQAMYNYLTNGSA
jgi:hypothetical protein